MWVITTRPLACAFKQTRRSSPSPACPLCDLPREGSRCPLQPRGTLFKARLAAPIGERCVVQQARKASAVSNHFGRRRAARPSPVPASPDSRRLPVWVGSRWATRQDHRALGLVPVTPFWPVDFFFSFARQSFCALCVVVGRKIPELLVVRVRVFDAVCRVFYYSSHCF